MILLFLNNFLLLHYCSKITLYSFIF